MSYQWPNKRPSEARDRLSVAKEHARGVWGMPPENFENLVHLPALWTISGPENDGFKRSFFYLKFSEISCLPIILCNDINYLK